MTGQRGRDRKNRKRARSERGGGAVVRLGWVTGLLFFATEPHNKFVRFHAMQSMHRVRRPACAWFLLCVSIPFLGWILSIFVFSGSAVVWLLLMFKAYQGERFKLPIAGDMAEERI